jgi:hypothetical protein
MKLQYFFRQKGENQSNKLISQAILVSCDIVNQFCGVRGGEIATEDLRLALSTASWNLEHQPKHSIPNTLLTPARQEKPSLPPHITIPLFSFINLSPPSCSRPVSYVTKPAMAASPDQTTAPAAAANSQLEPSGTESAVRFISTVEMNALQSPSAEQPHGSTITESAPAAASASNPPSGQQPERPQSQPQQASQAQSNPPTSESISQSTPSKPSAPATLTCAETEAIGPSTDTPAAKPDASNGPVVVITLLLTSGARHPYKIDERYLKKRNVNVEAMDPYKISVYTLKELIWRDWREGKTQL